MADKLNDFEEGTSGTTITTGNSAGAGETAFDTVTINAFGTYAYSNVQSAHGTLSAKSAGLAAQSSVAMGGWTPATNFPQTYWYRGYFHIPALPTSGIITLIWADYSGQTNFRVNLNTSGKLTVVDFNGTTQLTTTNTIPVNTWFRIEGYLTTDSSTNTGKAELKLFLTKDSSTPDETLTTANSAMVLYYYSQELLFGMKCSSAVNNNNTLYTDDIGYSIVGYLGPAAAPPVNANAGIATGTGAAKAAGYGLTPVLATGAGTVLDADGDPTATPTVATAAAAAGNVTSVIQHWPGGVPHPSTTDPNVFTGVDPGADVGEPGNLGADIGEPGDPQGT